MAPPAEVNFALGMTLMNKLCAETKENFVFSPLSLGTAFAMLVAGLKGDTKKEVLGLLGCSDENVLHKMYTELVKDKDLPLKIANKYLAHHECKVQANFDKLLKEKYDSEVEVVDFVKDTKKIENEVNSWVSSKTNAMIKQLLSPGTLTEDTVLVLLNAVYFKGTWVNEFEPLPYGMDFTLRDGTKVKKNFMTKKSSDFKYFETKHLKMVKIPYKEAGCYMIVAIPLDENKHIDEIMAKMTAAEMAEAVDKLNNARGPKVVLTMPKFKIDYKYQTLISHMVALGVKKIFKAGEGDFGDIFEKTVPPLYVSDIAHKAAVVVDEKGTKAAAATAIRVCCYSMDMEPEEFIEVQVDRPFVFSIHHSGHLTLFSGICRAPHEEADIK